MSVTDWVHFELYFEGPVYAFGMFPDLEVLDFCPFYNSGDFNTDQDIDDLRKALVHAVKGCKKLHKIMLANETEFTMMLPMLRDLPGVSITIRAPRPRPVAPFAHCADPDGGGYENSEEQRREDLRYTW